MKMNTRKLNILLSLIISILGLFLFTSVIHTSVYAANSNFSPPSPPKPPSPPSLIDLLFGSKIIGATGATGLMGFTGQKGPTGPSGQQGPIGSTGATGSQGPIGATGIQGNTGLHGLVGYTGATGVEGPQGVTGASGAKGEMPAIEDVVFFPMGLHANEEESSIVDTKDHKVLFVDFRLTGQPNNLFQIYFSDDQTNWTFQTSLPFNGALYKY